MRFRKRVVGNGRDLPDDLQQDDRNDAALDVLDVATMSRSRFGLERL